MILSTLMVGSLAAAPPDLPAADPALLRAAFPTWKADGGKLDEVRAVVATAVLSRPDSTWVAALIAHGPHCALTDCIDIEVVKLSGTAPAYKVEARRRSMPYSGEEQIGAGKPRLSWASVQIAADEEAPALTIELSSPDRLSEQIWFRAANATPILRLLSPSVGEMMDAQTETVVEASLLKTKTRGHFDVRVVTKTSRSEDDCGTGKPCTRKSTDSAVLHWNGSSYDELLASEPAQPGLVDGAGASSYLIEDSGLAHGAEHAVDGSDATAWVEGKADAGVGEWIELRLSHATGLRALELVNGFALSPGTFKKNNRVHQVKVSMEKGKPIELELKDTPARQRFELPDDFEGSKLRLEILSIYKGASFDDTCLGELRVER